MLSEGYTLGSRAVDPCQLGLWAPPPADPRAPIRLDLPGADVTYEAAFLDPAEAAALFAAVDAVAPWKQSRRLMFDRFVDVPRLQAAFSDRGEAPALDAFGPSVLLPPELAAVRDRLEARIGARFPWIMANLYRDGRDSVAMHADDEQDLGPRPVIASLSLGATRRFVFRPKLEQPGETLALDLPAGSLVVMAGPTQLHWDHGVPKVARTVGPRINLTFRTRDGKG